MRRLPVVLATTRILLWANLWERDRKPERAGLLPLVALAIDWPSSLAFHGLSDALLGFPRNIALGCGFLHGSGDNLVLLGRTSLADVVSLGHKQTLSSV